MEFLVHQYDMKSPWKCRGFLMSHQKIMRPTTLIQGSNCRVFLDLFKSIDFSFIAKLEDRGTRDRAVKTRFNLGRPLYSIKYTLQKEGPIPPANP